MAKKINKKIKKALRSDRGVFGQELRKNIPTPSLRKKKRKNLLAKFLGKFKSPFGKKQGEFKF